MKSLPGRMGGAVGVDSANGGSGLKDIGRFAASMVGWPGV